MLVTQENYKNCIKLLNNFKGRIAIDTETTGLQPYHEDVICGIAVKPYGEAPMYFPFRHLGKGNLHLRQMEPFKQILTRPYNIYVGHNYKFDLQMLMVDKIPLPKCIRDTQLAAHLLNENRENFKLKELAVDYIKGDYDKSEDELVELIIRRGYARTQSQAKGKIYMLEAHEVEPYACDDVCMTEDLDLFFEPYLKNWELDKLYEEVCDYSLVTTKMEIRGLQLDRKLIIKYSKEAEEQIIPSKEKLNKLAGYDINANSSKQLQAAMEVSSTAENILVDIIGSETESEFRKEFAKTLLDYRGWAKVRGTYYEPYLEKMDAKNVIHPNLFLTGTISGRLACGNPNLQALPQYSDVYKVKDTFIARKGYTLVSADYSQAEMRLAAHYGQILIEARNKSLIEILSKYETDKENWNEQDYLDYEDYKKQYKKLQLPIEESMSYILSNGLDMHGETARILGVIRDTAKRINLSILYGIGANTLSERLRCDVQVAAKHLSKYHRNFPGLKLLYNATETLALTNGYIRLWTGRVRHFGQGAPEHKASSNLIQGGIAEVMRVAILRLDKKLSKYDVHMLLQVHDQIIFEVPTKLVYKIVPKIISIMENFPEINVPMLVDVKVGQSWGKLTPWDKEKEG